MKRSEVPGERKKKKKRTLIWLMVLFLFVLSAYGGIVLGYFIVSGQGLPQVSALQELKPSIITTIRAESGEVICEFALEKRIIVDLDKVPQNLIRAIIAVEDAHFYHHTGVDPFAILRAAYENFKARDWVQGGSTLTQQLAKLLFLTSEKSLKRKIKEATLALQIEKSYSKREILQFYCNQIYLGHNRYGVEAASLYYFGKHVWEINLEEATLLAGIPQKPSAFSPVRNPESALRRRNHVLDRMYREGFIKKEEAEEAEKKPILLKKTEREENCKAPYFVEEVRQYLELNYGAEGLYREGLDVYTTLNLDCQKKAERAVRNGLSTLDKRQGFRAIQENAIAQGASDPRQFWLDDWTLPFSSGDIVKGVVLSVERNSARVKIGNYESSIGPSAVEWTNKSRLDQVFHKGDIAPFKIQKMDEARGELELSLEQEPLVEGSMVVIDQTSGAIKAMVGGYSFNRSKFNRVTQALRQPGSAFKPFVYGAALDSGFTAADTLFDEPVSIYDPWSNTTYSPENYEKKYHGITTLRIALEKSRNPISVKLLRKVGYYKAIDFAKRCGIMADLKAYPSLALGAFETTLLELTSAYGVFANQGIRIEPFFIHYIKDRDANIIMYNHPVARQVISREVAYLITYMLEGVIKRGTAYAAKDLPWTLAGKTGTTDDYTDAWFIGYSPDMIAGVWIGFDVKKSLGEKEVGAKAALPIWMEFVQSFLEGRPDKDFQKPDDIIFIPVDYHSGLRAIPSCETVIQEAFIRGNEPITYCSPQMHEILSRPYYLQRAEDNLPPQDSAEGAPDAVPQTNPPE